MKALSNLKLEDLLFIDIETVRIADELPNEGQLRDAWEYKARYHNEVDRKSGQLLSVEDYFNSKAALYSPFAKIVTIVVGRIKGDKLVTKSYKGDDEKQLLQEFDNDMIKFSAYNPNSRLVGFASNGFDLPMIVRRSCIHGIDSCTLVNEAHLKPWEARNIDLSNVWRGMGFYPDSLTAVAYSFGIESSKEDIDGSQVSDVYYEGDLDRIVSYCEKDVLTTARVFLKMSFNNLELSMDEQKEEETEVKDLPILVKAHNLGYLTDELKDFLSSKKLLKKDKDALKLFLESAIIDTQFLEGDDKTTVQQKCEKVEEFIEQLFKK